MAVTSTPTTTLRRGRGAIRRGATSVSAACCLKDVTKNAGKTEVKGTFKVLGRRVKVLKLPHNEIKHLVAVAEKETFYVGVKEVLNQH